MFHLFKRVLLKAEPSVVLSYRKFMSIVGKAHEEAAKEVEANGQLTGSRAKFSIYCREEFFLITVRVAECTCFQLALTRARASDGGNLWWPHRRLLIPR